MNSYGAVQLELPIGVNEHQVDQRTRERKTKWVCHRQPFDSKQYDVAPIDFRTAKDFVVTHHYSGSFVADVHRFGLFKGDDLQGVAVLSSPVQPLVLTNAFPKLTKYTQSLELGRFVLLDEVGFNGETWFLNRGFELARKAGVRGVVAMSDSVPRTTLSGKLVFPGHWGQIYRASNAICTGRASKDRCLVLPDGTLIHPRSVDKLKNGTGNSVEERLLEFGAPERQADEPVLDWYHRALFIVGVRTYMSPGNVRYLFPLHTPKAELNQLSPAERRIRVAEEEALLAIGQSQVMQRAEITPVHIEPLQPKHLRLPKDFVDSGKAPSFSLA